MKTKENEFINRSELLNFINNKENIYGMSFTYPDGWIKTEDLFNFIERR